MKKLWTNLITSNGIFDYNLELQRKAIILNTTMFFIFLVFFPLSIRGLIYRDIYIFSTIELISSFVLLYLIYFLRTTKNIDFVSTFLVSMLTLLVVFYIYIEKGSNDSFIWIPAWLFFLFFLKGFKQGLIITSILGLSLLALMVNFYLDEANPFTIVSLINISFAYFIFIAILVVYQSLLKNAENRLIEANNSLENKVQKAVEKLNSQQLLLIQKSKLEDLGETFAMLSHQWQQPLSLIAIDTNILLEKLKKEKNIEDKQKEDIKYYLDNISNKTQFMFETLNDFNEFLSPYKKESDFNVFEAIEKISSLLKPILKTKDIKILIKEDSFKDGFVFGKENEFKQIILNLLTNSLHSIEEQRKNKPLLEGEISIYIKKEKNLIISIKDNGTGIKLKDKNLFKPFITNKEKGTGLGLYMSRLIVENLGGNIEIKDIENGCEVKIYLPYIEFKHQ